jgi:inner membrane protein
MDPLAHTLFGATMAEAGLKRKTALATATLIIGANIPDVDAVAMFVSSDYALQVRRGWTHGILALMV